MPNILTSQKMLVLGVLKDLQRQHEYNSSVRAAAHQLLQNGFLEVKGPSKSSTRVPTYPHGQHPASFLLLASKSLRRRNCEASILSPDCVVELNIRLVNLAVTAEDKDVDALNWCSTWVQNESPAPCNDIASMPDVEGRDLVDAVASVGVAGFDRCKVGLSHRAVWCACEEIDAIRDLLVVRVGDGFDEGVVGCGSVAAGLLRLDERIDDCSGLLVCQAIPRLEAPELGNSARLRSWGCSNYRGSG